MVSSRTDDSVTNTGAGPAASPSGMFLMLRHTPSTRLSASSVVPPPAPPACGLPSVSDGPILQHPSSNLLVLSETTYSSLDPLARIRVAERTPRRRSSLRICRTIPGGRRAPIETLDVSMAAYRCDVVKTRRNESRQTRCRNPKRFSLATRRQRETARRHLAPRPGLRLSRRERLKPGQRIDERSARLSRFTLHPAAVLTPKARTSDAPTGDRIRVTTNLGDVRVHGPRR